MTNVAWRNLVGERTRFAISAAGVAFAVVLVLTLRGLYTGVIEEATRYVRTAGADLWVAQSGIPPDFIQATSILPAEATAEVGDVRGVAEAAPLLTRAVSFRADGRDGDLFLVGADPGTDLGWPAGRAAGLPRGRNQVLVDRVFARHFGVGAGDVLRLGPSRLVVAGTASGGNAFVYQLGWANVDDVADVSGAEGVVSYVLVRTEPGEDRGAVARRIERRVPRTQVFTGTELADRNADNLGEGFLPVLWVLMVVAFVVGAAVVGLIIYTATVEKAREFGILKAVGFSNGRLYAIVLQQSVLAAMTGFLFGAAVSFAAGPVLEGLVPVFVTRIRAGDVVLTAAAALLMAVVASFIPARSVARLDPAQVFKR